MPASGPAYDQEAVTVVKVSPENLVKITVMAVVGIAILRMAARQLNINGLSELVG